MIRRTRGLVGYRGYGFPPEIGSGHMLYTGYYNSAEEAETAVAVLAHHYSQLGCKISNSGFFPVETEGVERAVVYQGYLDYECPSEEAPLPPLVPPTKEKAVWPWILGIGGSVLLIAGIAALARR